MLNWSVASTEVRDPALLSLHPERLPTLLLGVPRPAAIMRSRRLHLYLRHIHPTPPLSDLVPLPPQSVGGPAWNYFSATCWFYGRQLHQSLGVPIGLVSSAYGSTMIRAWSPPEVLAQCANVNDTTKIGSLRGSNPAAFSSGFFPQVSKWPKQSPEVLPEIALPGPPACRAGDTRG